MPNMMLISVLVEMFSATLAPAGTGKPPVRPLTWSTWAAADAVAVALRLGLGLEELVAAFVAVLVVVIPAVHAARDRLAAQVTRAIAAFRYIFTALNLGARHARRIANMSQTCNIERDLGTCSFSS